MWTLRIHMYSGKIASTSKQHLHLEDAFAGAGRVIANNLVKEVHVIYDGMFPNTRTHDEYIIRGTHSNLNYTE